MSKELRCTYIGLTRENLKKMMVQINYQLEASSEQWLDAIIHFLDCLIEKCNQGQSDEEGYIHLKSEYLANTYGNKKREGKLYYKRLVDILRSTGVIEVNDSYLVKNYTKKYRINPSYRGTLVKEWIQKKSYYKTKEAPSPAARQHLYDLTRLQFDPKEAENVIKRLSYIQRLNLPSSVFKWSQNELSVSDDDRTRIYSTLTSLPKQFRGCLSYKDGDLHSADLRQAHPYLFIKVMKNWINRNCSVKFEEYVKTHPDILRYIQDVTSAFFISNIHNQIKKNKKECDLDDLKIGILAQVIYSPNKQNFNKITRAFADLYPTVWKILGKLKPEGSSELSNKLITLESTVMNRVIKELYRRHTGSLFIRLHDCCITTKDHIDETEQLIKAEGLKVIGYEPILSKTKFNIAKGDLSDIEKTDQELSEEFYINLNDELMEYSRKMRVKMFKGELSYNKRVQRCNVKRDLMMRKRESWKNQARMVSIGSLKESA